MFSICFKFILVAGILSGSLSTTAAPLVSYNLPKAWKLIESKNTKGAICALYEIKSRQANRENDIPSNALLQYYRLPNGVTPSDSDGIVAARLKTATLVVSGIDGNNWKTYIYAMNENKQQVIILYRIGIQNGYGVEVMISFPSKYEFSENKPFTLLTINEATVQSESTAGIFCQLSIAQEMVGIFNAFCASLKIGKPNAFHARVKLVDPPINTTSKN